MENLFQYWSYQYYTGPLLIIVIIWCLIELLRKGSSLEPHRLHWYAIAMLILWITNSILFLVFYKTPYQPAMQQTFRYMDFLFLTIEFVLFSHFFYHRTFSLWLKRLIIAMNIAFITATTVVITTSSATELEQTVRLRGWLFAVESVFFLLLSAAYFVTLFRESILRSLLNIPGCWITAGITLLMLVSVPLAIGEVLFLKTYQLWSGFYTIYYLLYVVFFLMIIKACHCKSTTETEKKQPKTTTALPDINPLIRKL